MPNSKLKNRFSEAVYDQYYNGKPDTEKTEKEKSERKVPKNRFSGMYEKYQNPIQNEKKEEIKNNFRFSDYLKENNLDTSVLGTISDSQFFMDREPFQKKIKK